MKRYQNYKSSGVPWLGSLPSHWAIKRVKHEVGRLVSGGTPSTSVAEFWDDTNGIPWVSIGDMSCRDYVYETDRKLSVAGIANRNMKVLPIGTVLYSMYASVGYASILQIDAATNQAILGCMDAENMSNKFLAQYLNAIRAYVLQEASSNTQDNLNAEKVRQIPLVVPPYDEQQAIATYLDSETARIDALIQEKVELIGLLGEFRQSVISEVLSGEHLPGAYSGCDWVPHLPTGWTLKRLKHLAKVHSGIAKGKDNTGEVTFEIPYLRVANVQDGRLDLENVSTIPVIEADVARYLLQPGDVLMNEGGDYDKVGRGAVWSGEISPCIHQNHVFAVRPMEDGISDWISASTQTKYAKFYFMNNAKQSTNLASISQTNIKELPILFPPVQQRASLLAEVRDQTARIDELILHATDEVSLLKELRAATIADAVLGRVDVRTSHAH